MAPLPDPVQRIDVAVISRPPAWRAWWLAARPKTLTVSVSPVLVGTALAYAEFGVIHLWPAFAAACAAMFIQIGTNLHNDVSDHERGADAPDRVGPPRATAMGWLSAADVRRAAWLAFGLAFLLGIALAFQGGWPIVLIGLLSLLAGWAYTGGPRPIAYTPLGEVFVIAFFGFAAVGGSHYLQGLATSTATLLAALMLGLFGAAVISVNNTRDLATDARVGKNTLAVSVGRSRMNGIYLLELVLPYLLLPLLAVLLGKGGWMALPALSGGVALTLWHRFVGTKSGADFNELLGQTARLQAIYALLLSAALLI